MIAASFAVSRVASPTRARVGATRASVTRDARPIARPSRVGRRALAMWTLASGVAVVGGADAARADGFAVGGVPGGRASGFGEDDYAYGTRDLAVDLASPLVAYGLVTRALRQEIPVWLDAITLVFVCGAAWVVFTGDTSLDAYLR